MTLSAGFMGANALAQGYQMVMARMLTPAEYGILVTLTTISYVLVVVMRTFEAWVIDAVAGMGGVRASPPGQVFLTALRTVVALGAAILVVLWVSSGWIVRFLHLTSATPVFVLGLYAFSAMLLPVACGVFMGLRRLHIASGIIVLEPVARLVVGPALVLWGLGVEGALFAYAVGNFLAFTMAFAALWPLLAGKTEPKADNGRFGSLDRYTLLTLTINACLMVTASVDQIAVKHYFSDEVAGNYAVAFLLGRIIAMTTTNLGWVLFTRSASMRPDDPGRARLLAKWLVAIGALSAIITLGYLVAPGLVVLIMGGAQYPLAGAYVGLIGVEMTLFSLVYIQTYYLISVKDFRIVLPLCVLTALGAVLLELYHSSVQQVLTCLILMMVALLVCASILSWQTLSKSRPRGTAVR